MTTDMTIKNYSKVTHDSGTAAGPEVYPGRVRPA